jgi:hypothetical protein
MDEKAKSAIQRKTVAELLDCRIRRGVVGETPVHDPACRDIEDHEDVQSSKRGGHHDEEVAREYRVGMIVEKRRPRLGRSTTATSGP